MEDVLDFTQDLVECVNNDTKVSRVCYPRAWQSDIIKCCFAHGIYFTNVCSFPQYQCMYFFICVFYNYLCTCDLYDPVCVVILIRASTVRGGGGAWNS